MTVDSKTKEFDPRTTMLEWEYNSVRGSLDSSMSDFGDQTTSEMWELGIKLGTSQPPSSET